MAHNFIEIVILVRPNFSITVNMSFNPYWKRRSITNIAWLIIRVAKRNDFETFKPLSLINFTSVLTNLQSTPDKSQSILKLDLFLICYINLQWEAEQFEKSQAIAIRKKVRFGVAGAFNIHWRHAYALKMCVWPPQVTMSYCKLDCSSLSLSLNALVAAVGALLLCITVFPARVPCLLIVPFRFPRTCLPGQKSLPSIHGPTSANLNTSILY